ncbi:hypothetical protein PQG94_06600 [Bacteroides stercoris]|uniref:hypothetical protein n=1 Tax=Bacteroides stercoris TaxID=46506 RepID=UPI00234C42E9|nr:hypothetical protein [Bacteroides stercoris]MDC7161475.1 hypothetical protein [Bacteroides stercoris]MDC7167290.1 hypothetical protein [Bacteroides stercoris]
MADGNIPSPGEAYFCHQICPVAVITFVVRKNKPGRTDVFACKTGTRQMAYRSAICYAPVFWAKQERRPTCRRRHKKACRLSLPERLSSILF